MNKIRTFALLGKEHKDKGLLVSMFTERSTEFKDIFCTLDSDVTCPIHYNFYRKPKENVLFEIHFVSDFNKKIESQKYPDIRTKVNNLYLKENSIKTAQNAIDYLNVVESIFRDIHSVSEETKTPIKAYLAVFLEPNSYCKDIVDSANGDSLSFIDIIDIDTITVLMQRLWIAEYAMGIEETKGCHLL